MTSKILALLLLSANLASAEPQTASEANEAIASERDAATRQRYHAQLTIIAERDIVTAQIIRDMALTQRELALRENRTADAERWEKRHAGALRDEQEAHARARQHAQERDQARADFEAAATEVRRLDRISG